MFQHLLITRFNVRIDRDAEPMLTEQWLENRLDLFENYCFPSVQAQMCQQFIWLILLDESTPDAVRQRMSLFEQQSAVMRVLYVPYIADLSTFYHQLALEYAKDSDYVLTTRLDNDDVIASTYIEDIQRIARQQQQMPVVISFPHGCQLFIKDSVGLGLYWGSNHFVSLLESVDEYTHTILDFDHTQLTCIGNMYYEKTSYPAWGEVVHGENVSNNYTPHNHPRVERWKELPFSGEWRAYLSYWKNWKYLLLYHLRYRKGSVQNLFKRFVR